jgi:hypothetical protein
VLRVRQPDLLALALAATVVPATPGGVLAGCKAKTPSNAPASSSSSSQKSGCGGKKTAAPAEAAPQQLAAEAAAAPVVAPVVKGEPGTHTIANLERVLGLGNCEQVGDLTGTLSKLKDWDGVDAVVGQVADGDTVRESAITEWLVLANRYQNACNHWGPAGANARDFMAAAPIMSETTVERALKSQRCAFVGAMDSSEAWPFPRRFAEEVGRSDFQAAEITRVLWLQSLEGYVAGCAQGLSARERVTAETRIKKLDRIIGLDDEVLIDLRSKMVAALQSGNADAVLSFSRAVNEREKALDVGHAADYDAKLKAIEAMVVAQKQVAADKPAAGKKGSSAVEKSANAAQTAANVAATAESAAKAAKATRSMMKLFGI